MTSDGRIEFQKLFPPPVPWRISGPNGLGVTHVPRRLTLRRIPRAGRSSTGRAAVRAALAEELQRSAGRPVPWRETDKGPELLEPVGGKNAGISISYTNSEAWLALCWEGPVGVDATAVEEVPDWEDVASLYLEESAMGRLRGSIRPAAEFSREWSAFEARLKLGRLSLQEGAKPTPAVMYTATHRTVNISVAVEPWP
jgi:hypothetical protein